MKVVGKTTDGKLVAAEIFCMFDSLGLPLADLFRACDEVNVMPSWYHFALEAAGQGWSDKTIRTRLREAVTDAYSLDLWLIVEGKLFAPEV